MQYKCSNCGGELAFDPASGKLRCPFCGQTYEIEQRQAHDHDHDHDHDHEPDRDPGQKQAADSLPTVPPVPDEEHPGTLADDEKTVLVEAVKDDRLKEDDGLSAWTCPHCGAHILGEESSAALVCPFCRTPLVVEEQISGRYAPKGIIPFSIDKKKLGELYETYIRSKPFYPQAYSAKNVISKIKGVYLPFWLYDMGMEGQVIGKGEKTITRREGKYQVTDHMVYHLYRSGQVDFEAIPVIAASNAQEEALNAIEPFDCSRLVSFSPDFMAGFLAQRYDQDEQERLPRAKERGQKSFENAMFSTMAGYQGLMVHSSDTHAAHLKCRYVLLPVWLLYMDYDRTNGEDGLIAVNGQSGAIAGNIPVDRGKCTRFFLRWFLIFSVLLFVLAIALMMLID